MSAINLSKMLMRQIAKISIHCRFMMLYCS